MKNWIIVMLEVIKFISSIRLIWTNIRNCLKMFQIKLNVCKEDPLWDLKVWSHEENVLFGKQVGCLVLNLQHYSGSNYFYEEEKEKSTKKPSYDNKVLSSSQICLRHSETTRNYDLFLHTETIFCVEFGEGVAEVGE